MFRAGSLIARTWETVEVNENNTKGGCHRVIDALDSTAEIYVSRRYREVGLIKRLYAPVGQRGRAFVQ